MHQVKHWSEHNPEPIIDALDMEGRLWSAIYYDEQTGIYTSHTVTRMLNNYDSHIQVIADRLDLFLLWQWRFWHYD